MPIKIVVTGPESTGKTTLCTQLSELYKGTMIPEFSREYLVKTKGLYQLADIECIGLTQSLRNNQFMDDESVLFCDTDAMTSYIWAKEKFQTSFTGLEKAFKDNPPDLYLLCFPDLRWEYDDLRENPNDLESLFKVYLEQIIEIKASYSIIQGLGRRRTGNARFFINNRFPELSSFVH